MYIIVFIITTNSIEFMYKVYIFMKFVALLVNNGGKSRLEAFKTGEN